MWSVWALFWRSYRQLSKHLMEIARSQARNTSYFLSIEKKTYLFLRRPCDLPAPCLVITVDFIGLCLLHLKVVNILCFMNGTTKCLHRIITSHVIQAWWLLYEGEGTFQETWGRSPQKAGTAVEQVSAPTANWSSQIQRPLHYQVNNLTLTLANTAGPSKIPLFDYRLGWDEDRKQEV